MDSNDDELKLLYLLSGSCDLLPPSYVKLRSYLNIHLSNIADQLNLQLLKSFRNRNKTCPYCYSLWSGITTSLKLLPSKRLRAPQPESNDMEDLKSQMYNLKEPRNKLVLKCKVCCKKSAFSLVKTKPAKEKVKVDNVIPIKKKKKKKKRDKYCGLAINLLTPQNNLHESLVVKKKTRMEDRRGTATTNISSIQSGTPKSTPITKNISHPTTSQNIQVHKHSPVSKNNSNSVTGGSKNFLPNPYASQVQHKLSKKKDKKLERLKQAVKEEKNIPRKTLKDFLTLV